MHAWRLTLSRHREDALTGIGAHRFGGRWNPVGAAVVYTSCSLELTVLEALVRVDLEDLADDYWWVELELPDDAIEVLEGLPPDWDSPGPYRTEVQALGARWIEAARSLGLRVPAAVLPERQNVLINPAHPRFPEVRRVATAAFTWPRRLAEYMSGR